MAKVLIVDDSPTQIALMRASVAEAGHVTVSASDGESALKLAATEKPNLILLDVVMPIMDGFQVCRKLRKLPECAATPIILISTKGQDTDKFWGMKQGATEYVVKPFDQKSLADLIRRHVR
ncbi:MAG: twitching motility response regulator PilH [Verrucomicrobiota bacterium]|jgi:twitching motility two-component system response regulator PilH